MKKIITLLLLLISSTFYGQFKLGITTSIEKHFLTSNDFEANENANFAIGSHFRININDKSEIYLDFLYSTRKVSFMGRVLDEPSEPEMSILFKQNNINYGFYYNYYLKHQKISVLFGPTLNYNMGFQLKKSQYEQAIFGTKKLTANDLENNNNLVGYLTIGATGGIDDFKLVFRYNYGLTNNYKNLDTVKSNDKFINLSLIYSINI